MKKLRFLISVWICKFLIFSSKFSKKKGSSTPGAIALKICPDALAILSKKVRGKIIAVCGTNGKTTTNNLIFSVIEKKGHTLVCNKVGANMISGVTTAFIEKSNIFGKLDVDFASIEIDEASARKVFKFFIPDIMIITNLFRDQLDRYGEVDLTVKYLKDALEMCKENTLLIVNADDPICSSIAKDYKGKSKYFGVNEDVGIFLNEVRDGQFCVYCKEKLEYEYYHYSQLGKYFCSGCDFKRPEADLEATDIDLSEGLKFLVNKKLEIKTNMKGFYNIYNILALIIILQELNINFEDINEILKEYKTQIGRMEMFKLNKPVILNLSKNPAGFNQGICTVLSDEKTKDVIVMINDNAQDGRDISWIWDVDFERLNNNKVKNFGLTGIRKDDLNIRFKYTDIKNNKKIYSNLREAIIDMLQKDGDSLYILVNYTAIFEAQDILKSLEKEYK